MNLCDIIFIGCDNMTDLEIIKYIETVFNTNFNTNYRIIYDSRDELLKKEPKLQLKENTLGVFFKGNIYINKDIIRKIRVKNNQKDANMDTGLTYLIHACFHELQHCIQREHPELLRKQKPYYLGIYEVEEFLNYLFRCEGNSEYYSNNHDEYLTEIDADIKGNRNLQNMGKQIALPLNIRFISLFEMYNTFRENNYEPIKIIEMLNKKIATNSELFTKIIDSGFFRNYQLMHFYSRDGQLTSIEDIMKQGDLPITKYFVSTPSFINKINNINLSKEQIDFVIDCLSNVIEEHEMKMAVVDKMYVDLKPCFNEFIDYTRISKKTPRKLEVRHNNDYYAFLNQEIEQFKLLRNQRKLL